jgi:hypothetical protein
MENNVPINVTLTFVSFDVACFIVDPVHLVKAPLILSHTDAVLWYMIGGTIERME